MQMPRFEVPAALVMEILSKLPVKSLTRFNCVCNSGHTYACVYFNHGAFVFDSKADDYKFIRFVTLSFVNTEYENAFAENMSQVELYSLKCDSWKEISSPNYTPCGLNWGDDYLDGICYWETTMGYYPDEKK
ncbi:hypothetical protein Gotur_020536 [Gossypium turneri]